MGGSSSVEKPSEEEQEEEALAASTGSLPLLQNVFAKLSLPETKAIPVRSLQEILSLNIKNLLTESLPMPEYFPQLLVNLGPSIVDLFFNTGKEDIYWVDFLGGYNRCCGRMPASSSINILYKLYSASGREAGNGSGLLFSSDSEGGKISGNLKLSDVLMLLLMCWVMSQSTKILRVCKGTMALILPDICHLITSAYTSCNEAGDVSNVGDCKTLAFEKDISAQKLHLWILTTVPGLAHCFTQYVQDRFHACVTSEDELDSSVALLDESSCLDVHDPCLLTCGRAWAISLAFRGTVYQELSRACFPRKSAGTLDGLLYRSSLHGKGLSRFWSNVEGYHGPLLLIIAANSADTTDGESSHGRWIIGVLTAQGFENRDAFYGGPGFLYALSPVFRVFSQSGKDRNFVYSHLHPSVRVYDPHPKPVGLAFGGTVGNERVFIDEDFSRVTVRHHAVDKTYQPGPLFPNQGFLATEAFIVDLEVWGLGGTVAKEQQGAYKRREQLFSEQRRKVVLGPVIECNLVWCKDSIQVNFKCSKGIDYMLQVDLKTFATWEDSPEKMMMDLIADPNRVQREDR